MDPNLYPITKIQSDFNTILPSYQQIDRESSIQMQNYERRVSVKQGYKQRRVMKKKNISKKSFKQVDSAEQAERLRKKLANRPKTYQTEKKMYMNTDFSTLGCSEQGKRTLRKRPSPIKKIKILKEKSLNQNSESHEEIHQQSLLIQEAESNKQVYNIIKKSQKILEFSDPYAQLPKVDQAFQDIQQIELKRLNLLSRKVEVINQQSF